MNEELDKKYPVGTLLIDSTDGAIGIIYAHTEKKQTDKTVSAYDLVKRLYLVWWTNAYNGRGESTEMFTEESIHSIEDLDIISN